MNFAPLFRRVIAGELDLFQALAYCHNKGESWVTAPYIARKFNRFIERDQFDPHARLAALRGMICE